MRRLAPITPQKRGSEAASVTSTMRGLRQRAFAALRALAMRFRSGIFFGPRATSSLADRDRLL
jgi:hypothetical protein